MKKLYPIMMSALLVASTASAAPGQLSAEHHSIGQKIEAKADRHGHVRTPNDRMVKVKKSAVRQALGDDIIYEAPEGKKVVYSRSAYSWYVNWFYIDLTEIDGQYAEAVFCDNNEVYFLNPNCVVAQDTYAKGIMEGNKITMQLPQTLAVDLEYDPPYALELRLFDFEYDEDGGWYYPSDNQVVTFTVAEDGTISLDLPDDGSQILGLYDTDYEDWSGYGDYNYTMTPFNETPVEAPATAADPYVLSLDEYFGLPIKVATEGSDVYFGGIYTEMPDAWFKGTMADGKVTVASGQYMGIDPTMNQFIYIAGAIGEQVYDEDWEEWYTEYTWAEDFTFNVEADGKTYTSAEGTALAINGSATTLYYVDIFDAPTLKPIDATAAPAAPRNPEDLDFFDGLEEYGYNMLLFYLPTFDVNGNYLDPNRMYYNIFTDQDYIETLHPEDYEYIDEEMTDIPYFFTDEWDIYYANAEHRFCFYFTGMDRIGVQSCYRAESGDVLKSDIVYYELAGTKSLAADKTVSSMEYFDLAGRRIEAPAAGLYVRKATYTDGTTGTAKVVIK